MNIELILTGTTTEQWISEGIRIYADRLQHYAKFVVRELPVPKNAAGLPPAQVMAQEAKLLQKALEGVDRIILLDEKGVEYSSVSFSDFIRKQMNAGVKKLAFVTGGAYGFDPGFKSSAHTLISLSKMTFTHQMARLFFTEQLYRAFTILKGESYHHE
jgi:23S rRNA (pseudouridine1915-N3)-methyltransferase